MGKLKERAEKYKTAPTVNEQKDMNYNTEEMQRYLVMNTAPEFFYNEQDNTLYWVDKRKDPDKVLPQRLANFEVLIKRRYNFVSGNDVSERLVVTIRGVKVIDLDISSKEYSSLMQQVKEIPGYFLYSTGRQQALFEQYISEIYWKMIDRMPIEIVYEESGWHQTETGLWHYYSGNDVNNCFSNFRLANNVVYTFVDYGESRELIEWGIGLFSISTYEMMLPLIIHAHLGYTLKFFEDIGYREQYILMMIGGTGSGKTTLARILFSLFGNKLVKGLINFTSTECAMEQDMMKRQDSTLVIDDLCKGTDSIMLEKFERVLRQLGDSTGRKKTINGGTEQVEVKTRCAVILTAESDIDALDESSKLRTLAVNIDKYLFNKSAFDMYKKETEEAQRLGRFSKLEQYMTMYVQFLERNYMQVIGRLLEEREIPPPVQFAFPRQNTIFIMMRSQLRIMLDFWRTYVFIPDNHYWSTYNFYVDILIKVLKENEERIKKIEPYIVFLQILKGRIMTYGTIASDKNTFLSYPNIYKGYYDDCNVMIISDWIYPVVANDYAITHKKAFPENFNTILKKLYEMKLIEVYEQKDHAPKLFKQVKINGITQHFICFRWQAVEMMLSQVESNNIFSF